MPDLSAHLTVIRSDRTSLRGYGTFFVGALVWTATVDTTPADGALMLSVTSVSGSYANVHGGFRVDVFTSGGYKGRTRTRYGTSATATTLPIREHSQGTVKIAAGDTVKVYAEVRLTDKLTAADETFAPEHETYSAQNANPGPVACSGGHWVGDSSMLPIQMTGDTSDWVDPDSNGPLTHLWTLPTGLSFYTGSANSDANPRITGDPGSYLVQHDVTDADNSVTTTQYVMIVIDDDPYDVFLDSLDYDETTGWSGSVRFKDSLSVDDVPDGSYFFFWVKETINGTRQSFGASSPGRSHIKLAGYLRRDEASGDASDDNLTFEIISPLARLAELVGYSKVMTSDATPDSWQQVKTLGIERTIRLLLLHYTNLVEAGFDFITHASWSDALYSQLFLNKSTPYGQVMELADSRDGRLVCDRTGRFELQRRLDLLPLADR